MKLTLASLSALSLLALSAAARPARGQDDDRGRSSRSLPLAGTPNPDPTHIGRGEDDDALEVIAVGSDDAAFAHPLAKVSPYQEDIADLAHGGEAATADVRNVQWAVQNVRAGGTVRLRNGPHGEAFHFGRSGIYLPGIRLVGAGRDASGSPATVVSGGLLAVRIDFLTPGDRAKVDGLWFQSTIEGAIYSGMADYDRLEITGNKSTGTIAEDFLLHPPNGQFFAGKLHFFVTAIGAAAVAPFTGEHAPRVNIKEIVVRGNVSDQLSPGASPAGGSEVEFAFCNYRKLQIVDNTLGSLGLSIEIDHNLGAEAQLAIEGNHLVAPDTTALWVVGNQGEAVVIDGNRIETSGGAGGVGLILSHATPDATFLVTRNQIALDQAVSGFFLGFAGTTLNGATFADNSISGTAAFGVLAFDSPGAPNTSSNNLFVANDFSRLASFVLDVFLGGNTSGNTFVGNLGINKFFSPNPGNVVR